MKNCTIEISLLEKSFITSFPIKENTPEYMIADEAYRLALMFAKTQTIAISGGHFDFHKFTNLMEDLDYNYTIK